MRCAPATTCLHHKPGEALLQRATHAQLGAKVGEAAQVHAHPPRLRAATAGSRGMFGAAVSEEQ